MNKILGPLGDEERTILLKEGAYIGNLFNFITEDELQKLNKLIPLLHKYTVDNRDTLNCRYDYYTTEEEEANGVMHSIPISEVAERDKFVKENDRFVQQIFYEFGIGAPRPDGPTNDEVALLSEIKMRITNFFYPEINLQAPPMPMFMLYEDGHFIKIHRDGGRLANPGRVCVVIIYLSSEQDYNDGGGEFVVNTTSGKIIETKPLFGTFSVLDFTANDVQHSVNLIKNNFKRLSSIHFFYENTTY